MKRSIYSVGQINAYIKNMFAQEQFLRGLCVRGEVSNCKYHSSGHIYFSLKDETGVLSCVMFAGSRRRGGLTFRMKDGDNVVVKGSVSVYERDGRYQLYADEITQEGEGILFRKFEELKRRLEESGMFAQEYKRPIPRYASRVGIVTAQTGAAIRDIVNISTRRNPCVQLILRPAQVQGEGAAASIAAGIRDLNVADVDVIIVGRGGGSMEDLWAFNEEIVARAIFESEIPVISAVGHETDVTIADFAADLRAPTPSAAAEIAVFDIRQVMERLNADRDSLSRALTTRIRFLKEKAGRLESELQKYQPGEILRSHRMYLSDLQNRMEHLMKERIGRMRNGLAVCEGSLRPLLQRRTGEYRHRLHLSRTAVERSMERCFEKKRANLAVLAAKMEEASPMKKLTSGYAFLTDENRKPVRSVRQIGTGDRIRAALIDGTVNARVEGISRNAGEE